MPNAQRAEGYRRAVREHGLPGDLSVAGYDNATVAALGPISLTSVDQEGRAMGDNAARLFLERIADRRKPSVQVKPSPTLVPCRTTAAPAGSRRAFRRAGDGEEGAHRGAAARPDTVRRETGRPVFQASP